VVHRKQWVRGRIVHVVQADLSQPHVRVAVATAAGGIGAREPWARIIDRVRPTAAITGTYFDVPSAIPIGTIVSRGQVVHRGGIGASLAIRLDNQVVFASHRPGSSPRWSGFETVLQAGPRLVANGRVQLAPPWEGFRDPAVYARRPRAAVGLTRHRKLLLVTVARGALLREMAAIMRELGAVEALCMDGGSSAGLYYRGKSHLVPSRKLTNLLVVYDSATQYQRFAPQLAPLPGPRAETS
jgi:exopolysaccharide biosynthesis protein